MVEFDLQTFLHDMRVEQREDVQALAEKVDAGFTVAAKALFDHTTDNIRQFAKIETEAQQRDSRFETRLSSVERPWRFVRWLMASMVAAVLGGAADVVFNHAHLLSR